MFFDKFILAVESRDLSQADKSIISVSSPERIYNPITAMGFSAMFTFQLNNTKR